MSPFRQAAIYIGTTYALALAVALLFPHNNLAQLLTMITPVLAVAATITFTCRRGERRRAWAGIGWRTSPRALLLALILPAAIAAVSFGAAVALGVARFPKSPVTGDTAFDLTISLILGSLLVLGEEIGWRGFLLSRLTTALTRRRAWLVTGALHAVFHLPLLLLTTTYQSEGNRLIILPMVLATITLSGVAYGWIRELSGGVWAPSVLHNAFNTFFETLAAGAVAGSAATLAYVTTETGIFTLLTVAAVATWLLRRARPVAAGPLPHPIQPTADPIG
jgi:membrane protease YdiL (CAAX protease family)